jgi:hypothetical protein
VTKRKKIIEDKKLRGEWAESVFMERATEHGLSVSKPWGEMSSYDFVIGAPGRFVSVQVKSTTYEMKNENELGYQCTVRGGHKAYRAGSFDFLAAYLVYEDAWYIIPAALIRGKKCIALYPQLKTAKYEQYREAWHLLRAASQTSPDAAGQNEVGQDAPDADPPGAEDSAQAPPAPSYPPGSALARMEACMNFARRCLEKNYPRSQKRDQKS